MDSQTRFSRLLPDCTYDFGRFAADLSLFEEGRSPPHMLNRDVVPEQAGPTDGLGPVGYYGIATISTHLGLRLRPDPVRDLREMLRWADVAFFGEWWRHYRTSRDQVGPTPPHEIRSRFLGFWRTPYCYGLLAALLLGDAAAAARLGGFVGPDLILDTSCHMKRPDLLFHCALGSYLRQGDLEDVLDEHVRGIEEGRSKRAKLWLRALRAVDAGTADAFRSAFDRVAADHLEREFSPTLSHLRGGPFAAVMQEGSILWHLADGKGIAPPRDGLPQDVRDRLLTLATATGAA